MLRIMSRLASSPERDLSGGSPVQGRGADWPRFPRCPGRAILRGGNRQRGCDMRRFLPIALAACVGGCSAGADIGASQQGVVIFHHMLDAGQFDAVYDGAGPELKGITP